MRCFYAAATERHDPKFRLTHGTILPNAEQAERAHLLLAGLERAGLSTEEPPEVPRAAFETVHSARFLDFLETGWDEWQKLPGAGPEIVPNVFAQRDWAAYPESIVARAGWHLGDTSAPIGAHSWEASRRAADCAVAAADTVAAGQGPAYALCRPPGHHTDRETAAGHCLMNVAAIAAERLRERHERVAILDIDVHHGNGTQRIFYDRSDVLFASIHTDPAAYYPFYLGYEAETGTGDGTGFNLNLPLPQGTGDDPWLAALDTALARIAEFDPGALVVSLGLDAHENDPLKGMAITFDGFRRAGKAIAAANLPTAYIQEGGYLSPDLITSLAEFLAGALDNAPESASA
ncbi:acetoin utilization deacetylase AcuC-like enzyme [Palleronia aestuarii]|uniref:Acetoin utilization deacetylase AcuC-like enzyme n=1 Tax=Palleronia aestuarii TaxID=568105 RepID=A0A2W7Q2B2_9RHOB|nr:histone deacetylase family protein [Palleronia aestuarii]PZX15949.1 acetoin utilization deacetylase AcuC-like enzyme [Palleronia aestuarii]